MDAITVKQLAEQGRAPASPQMLDLAGQSLGVEAWLRVLPDKRYVGRGEYQQQKVLVKLFYGNRAAAKARAEVQGITLLQEAGLATPQLVASGEDALTKAAWVITEYIEPSSTLLELIEGVEGKEPCPQQVLEVTEVVARLHNSGLVQADIHPDNFLYDQQSASWYVIDPAEMQQAAQPGSAAFESNIGLFLAQFADNWWPLILDCYKKSRSNSNSVSESIVYQQAVQWKQWRAKDLAAKSLRDCTLFQMEESFQLYRSHWRDRPELADLVPAELDQLIERGSPLKLGGSATLALVEVAGKQQVLKRYNLKNFRHWLKRFWRATRALHSWQAAHRLRTLGVQTPKPLLVVEERIGPLRKRGFLLAENCSGEDLLVFSKTATPEQWSKVVEELMALLALFRRYRIAHGDFKATNFIWNGRLNLIDLDAVQFFSGESHWRKAYNRDIKRLLQNWPENSAPYQALANAIQHCEEE